MGIYHDNTKVVMGHQVYNHGSLSKTSNKILLMADVGLVARILVWVVRILLTHMIRYQNGVLARIRVGLTSIFRRCYSKHEVNIIFALLRL
jgi:hypothetical protein